MVQRRFAQSLLAVVLLSVAIGPVRSDSPALNFTGISNIFSNDNWCLGWEFDVLSPVEVTGLGVFDGTGLSVNGHPVGLWDPMGNLIASATVFPTDPLYGSYFRFTPLPAAVTLLPGTGYRVAAVYPLGVQYGFNYLYEGPPAGWSVDPRIQWVTARYIQSLTLQDPTQIDPGVYGYFGGNILLRGTDPNVIPEPALLQLPLLMGLGGIGLWWRRRQAS